MTTRILALAALASLCACQSSSQRSATTLVQLYDIAKPDGVIEIELDRDGSLREMEAEVPVEDLPAVVLQAAEREVPGGRVTGAEREVVGDDWGWEVQMTHQGRSLELVMDEEGNLLESERELLLAEVPADVLEAAEAAIPNSSLKSVESVTRDGDVLYHVKRMRQGASYKIIVAPDGTVVRKVREARAEIEVPLRD